MRGATDVLSAVLLGLVLVWGVVGKLGCRVVVNGAVYDVAIEGRHAEP